MSKCAQIIQTSSTSSVCTSSFSKDHLKALQSNNYNNKYKCAYGVPSHAPHENIFHWVDWIYVTVELCSLRKRNKKRNERCKEAGKGKRDGQDARTNFLCTHVYFLHNFPEHETGKSMHASNLNLLFLVHRVESVALTRAHKCMHACVDIHVYVFINVFAPYLACRISSTGNSKGN